MSVQSVGNQKSHSLKWQSPGTAIAVLAMIAAAMLMQVELAFAKSINWDEFFHFSEIHRHLSGRPMSRLQVPYVWLFSWVPSLPGDNITHIQLIRLLILPFELVTIGAIVAAASRFASREEALFCGLLYVTGGHVFLHAFALRGDMIAASLLTVALWIGLCRPLRLLEIGAMAVLVGLAFTSTIKSVLYAPAFLGVALFRAQQPVHRWALAGATVTAFVVGILLLRFAPLLPAHGLGGLLRDMGELGRGSIDRMFSAGLFPQRRWLKQQILMAPLLSVAAVLAFIAVAKNDRAPMERVLSLFLLLPLCTVAVYRNAFPYHYVFILPPAMIAMAPALGAPLRRYGIVPLGLLLLAVAVVLSWMQDRNILPRQRTIQAGVHEIFPHPVTYIDDCGMVGDFPRAINHFASGWSLADYRRAGLPAYSMAMEAEPVPFVLVDKDAADGLCFDFIYREALLPEDELSITENYIQHWGKVSVAGRRIEPGDQAQPFLIAVPGAYTIEGGPVLIDGKPYSIGSVTELVRGPHVASGNRPTRVTLRWGDHLARPSYPWPAGPIFTEY